MARAECDTLWTPDIKTLFLMLFLVNVSLTLMLFAFWKTQKTYYGFKTWMLSLLVTSCGYSLFMTDGSVPVLISSTVADLFIALSVMMKLDRSQEVFLVKVGLSDHLRHAYSVLSSVALFYVPCQFGCHPRRDHRAAHSSLLSRDLPHRNTIPGTGNKVIRVRLCHGPFDHGSPLDHDNR